MVTRPETPWSGGTCLASGTRCTPRRSTGWTPSPATGTWPERSSSPGARTRPAGPLRPRTPGVADLGAIAGRVTVLARRETALPPPTFPLRHCSVPPVPLVSQALVPAWTGTTPPIGVGPQPTHELSGRVMQRDEDGDDDPLPRCVVSLFHRQTRTHIARTRTDAQGYCRFTELMPGEGIYFAVAFDPEGL